jgi:hypothetical protein
MELPIEHVLCYSTTRSTVLGQTSTSGPGAQCLVSHQTLDTVQSTRQALLKDVTPNSSCSVGPVTAQEALPYLHTQLFVLPAALAWRARQPSIETAPRDTERLAHQIDRPDSSVLRDEAELQIDSFAK